MDLRVILISGFNQHHGRWNGSLKLREKLIDCGHCKTVEYYPWKSDWKAIAEMLWLVNEFTPEETRYIVAGYSYGGGWGARLLFRYLKRRAIRIEHAILCDPVHRGIYAPLGWVGKWPIFVPNNVASVTVFRQEIDYPRGCGIKLESPNTQHLEGELLQVGHVYADDHPDYHQAVMDAVHDVTHP